MNDIVRVIFALWAVRIGANVLTYIHLWFVKEYRFDRMMVHLKTKQGKRILFAPLRIPPLSPKTVIIFVLSLSMLLFLLVRINVNIYLRYLVTDLLTFPTTALFVELVNLPTRIYHRMIIGRALHMLMSHTKLRVIGVTGSYGKTSTKEFMAAVLGAQFRVLKTEASKNSPIGIAETVIKNLTEDHTVFIVEMGAYKRGEIASMTRMVRPEIGLVTAINAQHQDLFGTLDTTMKAKYELIQGLPHNGIAVMNADDPLVRTMGEWAKRDGKAVWWYSMHQPHAENRERTMWASDIRAADGRLSFVCHLGKHEGAVSVSLLGAHQAGNVLAAIAGAVACGMPFERALEATTRAIHPIPKVMEPVKGTNGALFIDDTFNNNPDAARAALAFLEKTKGRKIFVFQPMIELGAYTDSSHEEIGEYAASVCDDIILTNGNFLDAFRRGVMRIHPDKEIRVMGAREAARFIEQTVTRNDTVVFKGKEAERILNRLTTRRV